MKKYGLLLIFLMGSVFAYAQYEPVTFDYEKSFFNEGNPLPAETYFIIQGEVPREVDLVQAVISKPDSDEPLHTATWKRSPSNQGNAFQIPITYKLRSNSEYDVRINYYRPLNNRGSRQFNRQLNEYLNAYIDQVIDVERNRIRVNEPVKRVVENLNMIVKRSTRYYDNKSDIQFPGFSGLVTKSIQNLRNQNLQSGKFSIFQRRRDSDRDVKIRYARQQINDLKELVQSEVAAFLNTDLHNVYDTKYISSYSTEKLPGTILVNVGYGGVYFSGNVDNLSYGSSPYAGISFPLANEAFASKIISRTTVSLGVFFNNFQNGENQTLSGPLINRPVYAALGYPVMEFLRINAGATIMQNATTAPNGLNFQQLSVRPFIGLSLDLNLWLGIGNQSRERLR